MLRFTLAILVGMFAWLHSASAQPYDYHVYVDADLQPTTGCNVSGGGQTFLGADYRVTATVTGNPPQVTTSALSACTGGAFQAPQPLPAGYPVGRNIGVMLAGSARADVVELAIPRGQLLGTNGLIRLGFGAQSASGSVDVMFTNTGLPNGTPMVIGEPFAIPTVGIAGLGLLALLMVLIGARLLKKHRAVASVLLVSAVLPIGVVAWAANFAADGQVSDWGSLPPIGTDPLNDPVPPLAATDIAAGFGAVENGVFFFRVDVVDLENRPPVAAPDSYSTLEDSALVVAAPGLLGNDSDPDPPAARWC
jgi:hypothetical protein